MSERLERSTTSTSISARFESVAPGEHRDDGEENESKRHFAAQRTQRYADPLVNRPTARTLSRAREMPPTGCKRLVELEQRTARRSTKAAVRIRFVPCFKYLRRDDDVAANQ